MADRNIGRISLLIVELYRWWMVCDGGGGGGQLERSDVMDYLELYI